MMQNRKKTSWFQLILKVDLFMMPNVAFTIIVTNKCYQNKHRWDQYVVDNRFVLKIEPIISKDDSQPMGKNQIVLFHIDR